MATLYPVGGHYMFEKQESLSLSPTHENAQDLQPSRCEVLSSVGRGDSRLLGDASIATQDNVGLKSLATAS